MYEFYNKLSDVRNWTAGVYNPVTQSIVKRYFSTGLLYKSDIEVIDKYWDEIPYEFKIKYRVDHK